MEYPFAWEMHAAWLFYRMSGHLVFDKNIKKVPEFWQYMHTPDGQMLRDGDGFGAGPEAHGHRIMISPKRENKQDHFLSVFQMADGDTKPLPVAYYETTESYVVTLADRMVSMNKGIDFINKRFTLKIPAAKKFQIILSGLKTGRWNIRSKDNIINFNTNVKEGNNTIFFQSEEDEYVLALFVN